MEKDLHKIDEKLSQLQIDFNKQIHAIEDDVNEFHKQLISLGVQNPDSKEMIEFIVFINDRIETKQTQFEDVLKETVKQLIDYKKDLIEINTKIVTKVEEIDARKPQSLWAWTFGKIKTFADIKIIAGFVTVLALIIMKIFYPEASDEFFKFLLGLFL